MSKMLKFNLRKFVGMIFILVLASMAVSCNHHRNDPGRAYMGDLDMYYPVAYDAYTANPVFSDSTTMQVPPAGTIARGQIPYPYKLKSMDEQVRAGKELVNPVPAIPESLQKGKELFTICCMVCHGEKGDGNGWLYTSKRFPAKPTSLIDPFVQNKPDGEIFHVLTVGSLSGLMGSYAAQIHPENRWNIINYVRDLAKNK